mgnify:FL=1
MHRLRRASGLTAWATAGALMLSSAAYAGDLDGDGVSDAADNCPAVANGDQWDSDADGLGNGCDADFDNDGVVSEADAAALKDAMSADYAEVFDLDADGVVGTSDWGVFIRSL